ncbi:putative 21 kDa protein [Melia azedarach]|uniref:21 kDa protein n=1 Tax=Melia azedarach TaxID=155640 RepID=A0ACC1X684_MELAZ|nr:putative 21 kDa protein [Melia azedarach]
MKSNSDADDFVKSSCGVTLYPDLCYETLSAYASTIQTSPRELANAALNVSLNEAKNTSALVLKLSRERELRPREAGAVKDCVENMRESVEELRQSLQAMKDLEGPEFEFQMSNIQTWVSAALTNEDTCTDNFQGKAMNGNVKDTIRTSIVRVSQLTSNALALINNTT